MADASSRGGRPAPRPAIGRLRLTDVLGLFQQHRPLTAAAACAVLAGAGIGVAQARQDSGRADAAVAATPPVVEQPATQVEQPATQAAPRRPVGEPVVLTGHTGAVYAVAFSPDGRTLATAGGQGVDITDDNTVRLWDTVTGEPVRVLTLPDSTADVAFSPDGNLVATAGTAHAVRIFDVRTGRKVHEFDVGLVPGGDLDGHNSVTEVAFSPDGDTVAAHSDGDHKVRFWDSDTGELHGSFTDYKIHRGIAFTPDGDDLAVISDDVLSVRSIPNGDVQSTYSGCAHNSVAFSADGSRVAAGNCADAPSPIWDARTGEAVAGLAALGPVVRAVTLSSDGTTAATVLGAGQSNYTVQVWDANTGRQLFTLPGHTYPVIDVTFSPDATKVATASFDGTARIWTVSG